MSRSPRPVSRRLSADPGVPSRWLYRYHPAMVAPELRAATPVRRMTIGEPFTAQHLRTWGADLWTFPLLSPRFCTFLNDCSDARDSWEPAPGDAFSAPEMRLSRLSPDLPGVIADILTRHVNPLLRRLFHGMYTAGHVEDPFLIRYSMRSQKGMGLHFDGQSDISMAVALNSGFEGGHLRFPRQGVTVEDVPVGHAVLFPGGPTHLHQALEITAGERRSLTIWTRAEPD